eukprot:3162770-Prymnesium_polylepis.1
MARSAGRVMRYGAADGPPYALCSRVQKVLITPHGVDPPRAAERSLSSDIDAELLSMPGSRG